MNANKLFVSSCSLVCYNEKCEGCESKNPYFAGCARVRARARNLDFTFVKVDEKVGRSDFRCVGIPSEDIQEVTSYFQNRSV